MILSLNTLIQIISDRRLYKLDTILFTNLTRHRLINRSRYIIFKSSHRANDDRYPNYITLHSTTSSLHSISFTILFNSSRTRHQPPMTQTKPRLNFILQLTIYLHIISSVLSAMNIEDEPRFSHLKPSPQTAILNFQEITTKTLLIYNVQINSRSHKIGTQAGKKKLGMQVNFPFFNFYLNAQGKIGYTLTDITQP